MPAAKRNIFRMSDRISLFVSCKVRSQSSAAKAETTITHAIAVAMPPGRADVIERHKDIAPHLRVDDPGIPMHNKEVRGVDMLPSSRPKELLLSEQTVYFANNVAPNVGGDDRFVAEGDHLRKIAMPDAILDRQRCQVVADRIDTNQGHVRQLQLHYDTDPTDG